MRGAMNIQTRRLEQFIPKRGLETSGDLTKWRVHSEEPVLKKIRAWFLHPAHYVAKLGLLVTPEALDRLAVIFRPSIDTTKIQSPLAASLLVLENGKSGRRLERNLPVFLKRVVMEQPVRTSVVMLICETMDKERTSRYYQAKHFNESTRRAWIGQLASLVPMRLATRQFNVHSLLLLLLLLLLQLVIHRSRGFSLKGKIFRNNTIISTNR